MARQGFFSRIRSAIQSVFQREPEPPVGPPPSDTPPPEPPRPPRDPFRAAWDAQKDQIPRKFRRRYRRMKEMFLDFEEGLNLNDQEEQLEDWDVFIRYMVISDSPYRRNDVRNPFWRHMGVDPGDFDWDAWRVAMGYPSRGD